MINNFFKYTLAILACVLIISCKKDAKPIAVQSVSLNEQTLDIEEGETSTLRASILPADADDQTISWASSNSSVASVKDGTVTAITPGSAVITVTTKDGGKKATCKVTVKPKVISASGVSLNKTELELLLGSDETLTASVLPKNATNKNVKWNSDKPDIATVDANGKVTAVAIGTAIITVTTQDGNKTATCNLTVKPIDVSGVSLNKTKLELTIGLAETLTATVLPDNAGNKNVKWSSDNTGVATVDAAGKVTAVNVGTANIMVTTEDGNKTATCNLTVKPIDVSGVTLNKTKLELTIGLAETLTATVLPNNATNKNVKWSSDKPDIATVDATGKVTAVNVGTAIITVTTEDGNKTATCTVTVNPVHVTEIFIKAAHELTRASSSTLIPTIWPRNATNQNVTWISSDPETVSVDQSGKITGLKVGTADITVTTEDGNFSATCTVTVNPIVPVKVTLNKKSIQLQIGGYETLTATVYNPDADNKNVSWSSSDATIASVDQNGKITGVKIGTATITVTTESGNRTATCAVTVIGLTINGRECVSLGLPSGIKWATCNVGASTPEDYGDYYAWGDADVKTEYGWNTYKFTGSANSTVTKYVTNSSYGEVDNLKNLESIDDVANQKWGGTWRMPTIEEFNELRTNCTWTWDETKKGFTVVGPNGNSIFLPAAGCFDLTYNKYVGERGFYWTSSLYINNNLNATYIQFLSSFKGSSSTARYIGRSIRPVSD